MKKNEIQKAIPDPWLEPEIKFRTLCLTIHAAFLSLSEIRLMYNPRNKLKIMPINTIKLLYSSQLYSESFMLLSF
jgi:hypothetical protein